MTNNAVFELVDYTTEEMYFPIGIYQTLDEAKKIIKEADKKGEPISDYVDDYEVIKIIKREFGLSGNGENVFTAERERKAIDEKWETIKSHE